MTWTYCTSSCWTGTELPNLLRRDSCLRGSRDWSACKQQTAEPCSVLHSLKQTVQTPAGGRVSQRHMLLSEICQWGPEVKCADFTALPQSRIQVLNRYSCHSSSC